MDRAVQAAPFRSANPMFQIARGAPARLLVGDGLAALRRMPVVEFTAIRCSRRWSPRWVAKAWLGAGLAPALALVVGGFLGALIVVRPGGGPVGWAALLPLAATFSMRWRSRA